MRTTNSCACAARVEGDALVVDVSACDDDLVAAPACRETVVARLATRDVDAIVVRDHARGREHHVGDRGVALLVAAGRFVDLVAGRDGRLAALARRDPLAAAREAAARVDATATATAAAAAESGLSVVADGVDGYADALAASPDESGRPAPRATHLRTTRVDSRMFYEQRTTAPDSPAAIREEYETDLAAVLGRTDLAEAVATTGIDRERLDAVAAGDAPDLSLEEAAEILALDESEPDAETIVATATENLLLGMSTAVLDVDRLASELAIDLDPREIQQKIERREPMSLDEFVHVEYVIADRTP